MAPADEMEDTPSVCDAAVHRAALRPVALAGRLQCTSSSTDQEAASLFESYKQTPELLSATSAAELPQPGNEAATSSKRKACDDEGDVPMDVDARRPFGPSAAEMFVAEACRRRDRCPKGQLVLLCGGHVAACALGDVGLALYNLRQPGSARILACGAAVLSLCPVQGGGSAESMLLASNAAGGLLLWRISFTDDGFPAGELVSRTQPEEGFSGEVWTVSANLVEGAGVVAVAHRSIVDDTPDQQSSTLLSEVLVLTFSESSAKLVARLRGSRPPQAASCSAHSSGSGSNPNGGVEVEVEVVLVSESSGFAPSGIAWAVEEDTGLATIVRISETECQAKSWALPHGDLLAAWASGPNLAVLIGKGRQGSATALQISVGDSELQLSHCEEIPGLAACASAREKLTCLLPSQEGRLFALVEVNAVSVFRHPEGQALAATASLQLPSTGLGYEVLGAAATDHVVAALTPTELVWSTVDLTAHPKQRPAPKKKASQEKLPMGIDREALLRMLDMRGED